MWWWCHRPRAGSRALPSQEPGEMAGWVGGGLGLPDGAPPLRPSPPPRTPAPTPGEPVTLNRHLQKTFGETANHPENNVCIDPLSA